MADDRNHSAGIAKSRRQVLRLVGVGGVLSAAGAAGVMGVAAASSAKPVAEDSENAGAFPAGGITVVLAVPDAGEATEFYRAAFRAETLVAARSPEGGSSTLSCW